MMQARRSQNLPTISIAVLSLAWLAIGSTCRAPHTPQPVPPTRSDRLMQAYPDLRSGRFAVVADFENPAHMELFQLIKVSPQAEFILNTKRGRPETGRSCLQLTTGSPDDIVVLNNEHAAQWYLKRDWRPYNMLLMGVHAPGDKLNFEISIGAGPPDNRIAVQSSLPLERGWNDLRLDLGEVGERLAPDDVQELRFSITGADKPVDVYLDDIILTASRENLFGDPQNRDGDLYVQRMGRRWNIGAGGRFELTFANGQIVAWYNLASDPYRLGNLVRGTTLGPSPMIVVPSPTNDEGFGTLGTVVVARPQILEMNQARIVLACDWRFVDDPNARLDDRPFQRWLYAIYPSGQIYVTVECTAATKSWAAPQLGLAVTLVSTEENDFNTYAGPASPDASRTDRPACAWARSQSVDAFLLYTLSRDQASAQMIEQYDAERRRLSFVAVADSADAEVATWQCRLLLAPADEVSDEEALARAVDYAEPVAPRVELGSLDDSSGRTTPPGFDRTSGCFKIAPERGRVRFIIDGRQRPGFSPAFEIVSTDNREAWVYVNHLVHERVGRTATGNLVFEVPGTIRDKTVVEVLFRRRPNLEGA